MAGPPVRQIAAGLLPVDERRLITPVIQAAHRAQMRFTAHEGVHRTALLPGGARPVRVVCLGEHVCPEVAAGVLRLFRHGNSAGEELVKDRWVPEPQPGNDDDRHCDLPAPQAGRIPARPGRFRGYSQILSRRVTICTGLPSGSATPRRAVPIRRTGATASADGVPAPEVVGITAGVETGGLGGRRGPGEAAGDDRWPMRVTAEYQ